MEERKWEDLKRDCLVNVLRRVDMESRLINVPFVCKSWRKACLDPLCWKSIEFPPRSDIWSYPCFKNIFKDRYGMKPIDITKFMKFIIDRSCGNATKLVLPTFCTEEALKYAANKCSGLEILGMQCRDFRDFLSIIPELIGMWKNFKGLILGNFSIASQDYITKEEASAIVTFLPNIKYLHLRRVFINQENLVTILQGCKQLVHLNVISCTGFNVDEQILELASHIRIFKYADPSVKDLFEARSFFMLVTYGGRWNLDSVDCEIFDNE